MPVILMYKIPLPELKEKIIASGKVNAMQLELKIKQKINDLSSLISEEGAAHIIANELGVELISSIKNRLKIKEIYVGMRNITTLGKVVRKFEIREFSKDDQIGKVRSLILGDDTGTIRTVFWNDQVKLLDEVDEGDVILIKDAYVKENNNQKEVHLSSKGEIVINPEGETVNYVRVGTSFERKSIADLKEGDSAAEILGVIVQVFDPRFFNVCPNCNKRVKESDQGYLCEEHGTMQPNVSYVMNIIMDDGTGNIRGVLWKNQTNHLLDKTEEEVVSYKDNLSRFEEVKNNLLGEQFRLAGQVKKNEMFSRLEFNVQLVNKAKPEEEIARLEKVN